MPELYTTEHTLKDQVSVWAIPVAKWIMDEDDWDGKLFTYKVYANASTPYQDGAVKVCDQDISCFVPGGINLVEKAIETLEGKKNKAFKEFIEAKRLVDEQIDRLKLIAHVVPEEAPTTPETPETPTMELVVDEIVEEEPNVTEVDGEIISDVAIRRKYTNMYGKTMDSELLSVTIGFETWISTPAGWQQQTQY